MSSRPVSFSVSWSADAVQRFALELSLADPVSQEAYGQLRERVDAFVDVAARGGFVVPHESPAVSELAVIGESRPRLEVVQFGLEARSLDVRSFRVLQNLIETFSDEVHLVRAADVQTFAQSGTRVLWPALTADNAEDLYPAVSDSASVRIDADEPVYHVKSRRCVAEFAEAGFRQDLEKLQEWMNAWAVLVSLGGYALRLGRAADVSIDTLRIYDEYSVELVFSLFEAAEEAWNPLLNLLSRFSSEVHPITLVTLD
jgi:hypothetical protein